MQWWPIECLAILNRFSYKYSVFVISWRHSGEWSRWTGNVSRWPNQGHVNSISILSSSILLHFFFHTNTHASTNRVNNITKSVIHLSNSIAQCAKEIQLSPLWRIQLQFTYTDRGSSNLLIIKCLTARKI